MTITSSLGPDGYTVSIPAPVSGGWSRSLLVGAIGDSRMVNALQDQTVGSVRRISWSAQGALTWLLGLARGRMYMPPDYIKAVSGAKVAEIAAQVPVLLALSPLPRICFVNGGTNTFSTGWTDADVTQAVSDMTGAMGALRAGGVEPVFELDCPRTLASWTANQRLAHINYNRAMRVWCRDNGVRIADPEMRFCAAGGDVVAGYNVADGVHQAQTGAVIRALEMLAAVEDLLPAAYTANTGQPADSYDAVYNRRGNLLTIGLMTGTAGANAGTGASGTVSTGWTNQVVSGTMTAVASKESPRSDGLCGDRQIITLTCTVAGQHRFAPTAALAPAGKFSSGDVVLVEADVEITSCSGVVDYLQLNVFDFDGANSGQLSVVNKNTFASGLNPMPLVPLGNNTGSGNAATTLTLRLRTTALVMGDGITSTALYIRIEAGMTAGSAIAYKIGDVTARKVI